MNLDNQNPISHCPFCGTEHQIIGGHLFDCIGTFDIELEECEKEFKQKGLSEEDKIIAYAKISHFIAQNYMYYEREAYTGYPKISPQWVLENRELPLPAQQASNLLLYVAQETKYFGKSLNIKQNSKEEGRMQAWAGAVDRENLTALLSSLVSENLLDRQAHSIGYTSVKLTLLGWNKVSELQKINTKSTESFMAMQFDEKQIDFINKEVKPIVKETGFHLKLLPEFDLKENLIDDRLRVAIKKSRFIICDLTHGNRGAYWEAGYAEGLGLPVIYICEKGSLNDKTKVHFDVNHQQILLWEKDKEIKPFLDELKAKIILLTQ